MNSKKFNPFPREIIPLIDEIFAEYRKWPAKKESRRIPPALSMGNST
jgi:hypothetical protein